MQPFEYPGTMGTMPCIDVGPLHPPADSSPENPWSARTPVVWRAVDCKVPIWEPAVIVHGQPQTNLLGLPSVSGSNIDDPPKSPKLVDSRKRIKQGLQLAWRGTHDHNGAKLHSQSSAR